MSATDAESELIKAWSALFADASPSATHADLMRRADELWERRASLDAHPAMSSRSMDRVACKSGALEALSVALRVRDPQSAQAVGAVSIGQSIQSAIQLLDEPSGLFNAIEALFKAHKSLNDPAALNPLETAFTWRSAKGVRALIKAGADVNKKDSDGSWPALNFLSGYTREDTAVEITEMLLQAGLNARARGKYNNSLAHACAVSSQDKSLGLLLKAGADANALGPNGVTPLNYACQSARARCAQTLLDHGADSNLRDGSGCSPLDVSAFWAQRADARRDEDFEEQITSAVERVAILLRAGADPLSAREGGLSALERYRRNKASPDSYPGPCESAHGEAMEAWAQALEIGSAMSEPSAPRVARSASL